MENKLSFFLSELDKVENKEQLLQLRRQAVDEITCDIDFDKFARKFSLVNYNKFLTPEEREKRVEGAKRLFSFLRRNKI